MDSSKGVDNQKLRALLEKALIGTARKTQDGSYSKIAAFSINRFKAKYFREFIDNDLINTRNGGGNVLWQDFKDSLPDKTYKCVDKTVEEAIEELVQKGIVQRGGKIENGGSTTKYSSDDYDSYLLTGLGLTKIEKGETLFGSLGENIGLAELFDSRKFHPSLVSASRALFVDGHFPQAIFESCKALEICVQTKSGLSEIGYSLMSTAFSEGRPVLKVNGLRNKTDHDEQKGIMHLFQGATSAIRNIGGHSIVTVTNETVALEYLSFISLLFRRVDDSTCLRL